MTVLAGNLLRAGDEEYARLCSGWNTRVVHRPEYCVDVSMSMPPVKAARAPCPVDCTRIDNLRSAASRTAS